MCALCVCDGVGNRDVILTMSVCIISVQVCDFVCSCVCLFCFSCESKLPLYIQTCIGMCVIMCKCGFLGSCIITHQHP